MSSLPDELPTMSPLSVLSRYWAPLLFASSQLPLEHPMFIRFMSLLFTWRYLAVVYQSALEDPHLTLRFQDNTLELVRSVMVGSGMAQSKFKSLYISLPSGFPLNPILKNLTITRILHPALVLPGLFFFLMKELPLTIIPSGHLASRRVRMLSQDVLPK
jgi:hypothetical protein